MLYRFRLALAGVFVSGLSACATTGAPQSGAAQDPVVAPQPSSAPQAVSAADAPGAAAPVVTTTASELQAFIAKRQVNELRTVYNGSYGASLLFKPDDLMYYAVLFQQNDFWRVVKTASPRQAEAAYRVFADQSAALAKIDFDRIRLQAENAKAEKVLAERTATLNTLQADQALRQQQEQQVAQRQQELRGEAQRLQAQQQSAREQLRALQNRINALQAEQNHLTWSGALDESDHGAAAKSHPPKKKKSVYKNKTSLKNAPVEPSASGQPAAEQPASAPSATQPDVSAPITRATEQPATGQSATEQPTTEQPAAPVLAAPSNAPSQSAAEAAVRGVTDDLQTPPTLPVDQADAPAKTQSQPAQ